MHSRNFKNLAHKIKKKKALVGIIGIGYVGSSLGKGAAAAGFKVKGYARSGESIKSLNSQNIKNFSATDNIARVLKSDIVCICVPTPVTQEKLPDLEALNSSIEKVTKHIRSGQLVIIESTIAPGTTRNKVLSSLKQSGLIPEEDFFLAFSPERVDPGNKTHTFAQIPKIVGGLSNYSTYLTFLFYKAFVEHVYPVSSLEAAEMSKMLENTFRLVNISLVNEISEYTRKINVDIFEVLAAASTKPFGFMPHYPGPGIGGHCIPVDPYYMLNDAQDEYGVKLGIVDNALLVNEHQPLKVVSRAIRIIKKHNGVKKRSHKALLVGVSYKQDIEDTRETPALPILRELEGYGIEVSYYDPYVNEFEGRRSINLSIQALQKYDIIIIVTQHSTVNYSIFAESEIPILDTRNALKNKKGAAIYNLFSNNSTPKEKYHTLEISQYQI